MPDFTRGAIVLEGDLPFGADFYYGIKSPVLPGLILQVNDKENEKWEFSIPISFALSEDDMGHPNVAKIEACGKNGAHVTVVGRSLGGGRVLITEIDGYPVEITGEEYTFLTRHHDVPGIVAEVCRALAAEEINISNMRLFRKGKGDEAVMIIHTDQCVSQKLADEIAASNANIVYAMAMDII